MPQSGCYLFFYFSEPRTINGYFAAGYAQVGPYSSAYMDVSTDTTNGVDGTWTRVHTANGIVTSDIRSYYRTSINTVGPSTDVRGVRIRFQQLGSTAGSMFGMAHLYGSIQTATNPDRLAIWDATLDQPISGAFFDLGDVERSSTASKTFRVKNVSSTLTAQGINLNYDALYDGTPTVVSGLSSSPDGSTFTSTLNIGDLAPGATSGVLTMRISLPANAPLGVWAPRLKADATSWV